MLKIFERLHKNICNVYHLTDGDANVEQLAEKEAECILVELIVDMLEVILQEDCLLLLRILNYSTCKIIVIWKRLDQEV